MAIGSGFDFAAGTMTADEARSADDHLLVEFYKKAVVDELLTNGGLISVRHPRLDELKERGVKMKPYIKAFPTEDDHFVVEPAGRLICRDVEFIRIITPGDRNKIVERPVEDADKKRFARRYENWKTGQATAGRLARRFPRFHSLQPRCARKWASSTSTRQNNLWKCRRQWRRNSWRSTNFRRACVSGWKARRVPLRLRSWPRRSGLRTQSFRRLGTPCASCRPNSRN